MAPPPHYGCTRHKKTLIIVVHQAVDDAVVIVCGPTYIFMPIFQKWPRRHMEDISHKKRDTKLLTVSVL